MVVQKQQLRVIAFGAHPDDCEYYFGGTAAKFVTQGHKVKFVSVTSGDAGHHQQTGPQLAERRRREAREAARRLGIAAYDVLPNPDGRLVASLELRETIIRLIRDWNADLVLTHRPNDYHPDHRATALAVQDAAYLVLVPSICPDTPVLRQVPVFLYFQDDFSRPYPFQPDVVVVVDDVWERKLLALDAHESQFYEWLPWADWGEEQPPRERVERLRWLEDKVRRVPTSAVLERLRERYGHERAAQAVHVEAFELCEYGRSLARDQLNQLFPF